MCFLRQDCSDEVFAWIYAAATWCELRISSILCVQGVDGASASMLIAPALALPMVYGLPKSSSAT